MDTTTPSTGFRIGFVAGTVLRGLLNSLRNAAVSSSPLARRSEKSSHYQTAPSQQLLSQERYGELEREPAMVRRNPLDLSAWYASNVRTKPKRTRKPKAANNSPIAGAVDQLSSRNFGPLDTLIAPVGTPVDWRSPADCNTPHWMDNLNTDHWTEADWDRLSR